MSLNRTVTIGLIGALAASHALADEPVARLTWDEVLTGGPNCTTGEDPTMDLWVIEDFSIDTPASILSWSTQGTVCCNTGLLDDVIVRIYDRFPTDDGAVIVMESVPGTGVFNEGQLRFSTLTVEFDGSILPAGEYHLAWTAFVAPPEFAVVWSTEFDHDIGGGAAQNAWLWNLGEGFGWPENPKPVPDDLYGNGQTGVNFTIFGEMVSCPADIDGDGDADAEDFFAYLDAFAGGDQSVCDIDGDGDCDAEDFFGYLDLFTQPC